MIRHYNSLTPPAAEIGRDGDWKSASLVEEIGESADGETTIMQTLNGASFELWHKSGLMMRIPVGAMLTEACHVLRLEAESRETADAG